jgi:hypothetical protein
MDDDEPPSLSGCRLRRTGSAPSILADLGPCFEWLSSISRRANGCLNKSTPRYHQPLDLHLTYADLKDIKKRRSTSSANTNTAPSPKVPLF